MSLQRGFRREVNTPANQSHPKDIDTTEQDVVDIDTTEQDVVDIDTVEQDVVEQKIEFNTKKGKHYGK